MVLRFRTLKSSPKVYAYDPCKAWVTHNLGDDGQVERLIKVASRETETRVASSKGSKAWVAPSSTLYFTMRSLSVSCCHGTKRSQLRSKAVHDVR